MAGFGLEAVKTNVTSSVTRMTNAQRLTLGAAFLAVAVALFAVSRIAGSVPMRSAYTNLDPAVASDIVDQIKAQGYEFDLVDNGRTIRVADDKVDAVRLVVASQGIVVDGQDGWGVLDGQGLTSSNFEQRVGFQRAMQGELAKTIETIDGVLSANVHLVMPEDDLFTNDDIAASASIVVNTGNATLHPEQVTSIVNLVASGVEGLTPERVSVSDSQGQVLKAPGDDPQVGLEGDGQLRMTRQWETALEQDIEEMLSKAVGPSRAVANVTVDLDFDQVNQVSEVFTENVSEDGSQVAVNEDTRVEQYGGDQGQTEVGVLSEEVAEQDSTTSAADGSEGGSNYSLNEINTEYAVNKTITETRQAPGRIKALSVAVLLDEGAADAAVLSELEALIAGIAGINPERGDQIKVSIVPFDEAVSEAIDLQATSEPEVAGLDILGIARMAGTVLVGLVVLFLGLRSLKAGAKREVLDSVDLRQLPAGGSPALGAGGEETDEDGEIIERPKREDSLSELIANQPDDVAGLLRSWLDDEVAV